MLRSPRRFAHSSRRAPIDRLVPCAVVSPFSLYLCGSPLPLKRSTRRKQGGRREVIFLPAIFLPDRTRNDGLVPSVRLAVATGLGKGRQKNGGQENTAD